MSSGKTEKMWRLEALTDVWTGDIRGEGETLRATGLLGSIRWWFEVLVRGLGGSACDPTRSKCQGEKHCAVCELFGCTGWARKFGFHVMNDGSGVRTDAIRVGGKTSESRFRLRFVALRPIRKEEWALLDATLRLIAVCGAMGAKTVYKPDTEADRKLDKPHHRDYGLVRIKKAPDIEPVSLDELTYYLSEERDSEVFPKFCKVSDGPFRWASLENFWFSPRKVLDHVQFNRVVNSHRWLAGRIGESKKMFSFVCPKDPAAGARTFGFVRPSEGDGRDRDGIDFDEMRRRLQSVWGEKGLNFFTGDDVKKGLFARKREKVDG